LSVWGKRQIALRVGERRSKPPVDYAETLKHTALLTARRTSAVVAWRVICRMRWHCAKVRRLAARQPDAADRLIAGRMIDTVLRCLIWMEACVGAHHLNRTLGALGHDAS